MVRKASREVLGVFLRELGKAARLAAANTGDRVGHRLPYAPAVGRGYEGELVGAPPRQATLGDEDFAKGLRVGILVGALLPDGLAYAPGGSAVGERLRSAHQVGYPLVSVFEQGRRGHSCHVAHIHQSEPMVAHGGCEAALRSYGGSEAQEVLHVK